MHKLNKTQRKHSVGKTRATTVAATRATKAATKKPAALTKKRTACAKPTCIKARCAKLASALLCVALAFGLSGCIGTNSMRFITGGESGTYYAFGSVIAQHATNNTDLQVNALSGNGSQANIQALEDIDAELAFCQSDVMAYAYTGTNLFEKTGKVDCFSTVCALYTETVQIVTCDPNIKNVSDLRGKTVSVGAANSGVYFNAMDVLGAYDITLNDISAVYQSFGDSTDSLKDGKIDAAFVVAGAPTTSITDLSTSKQAYLVGIDDEHLKKITSESNYYTESIIPAQTYSGMEQDTQTIAVGAVVLARDGVSEENIYEFVKDIFESAPDQVQAHAKYSEVNTEFGASITSVPYHPGAAKYFKEKGYEVAVKDSATEAMTM